MNLHRYELKSNAQPALFGHHTARHYWAFEWFYPVRHLNEDEKIGMCGLPKPIDPEKEHSCLISHILSGNEPLLITRDNNHPIKRRTGQDKLYKTVDAHLSGRKETSNLVNFLRKHPNVHFYMSSIGLKDECRQLIANIATFAPKPPAAESYSPIQNIKIDFQDNIFKAQYRLARAKFGLKRKN